MKCVLCGGTDFEEIEQGSHCQNCGAIMWPGQKQGEPPPDSRAFWHSEYADIEDMDRTSAL